MRHKIYSLFLIILLFTACTEESSRTKKSLTMISQKKISSEINSSKSDKKKVNIPKNSIPKEYTFIFEDLQKKSSTIKMKNDFYSFSNIEQPIVMVTIFSTWCPPCRGQIPHLSSLQKKFKKSLFILGALVHDDIQEKALKKFIISEKALFFISTNQPDNLKFVNMLTPKLRLTKEFPMPLMILFFHGKYFTHYEGSMPEEMIESDIEQLLIKIRKGQ